jgi:hypothetical protein
MPMRILLLVVVLTALSTLPAEAQAQRRAGQAAPPARVAEPRLVFEREVYAYPGASRRDPFQPLTGRTAGPLFTDLKLHVIIFVDGAPGESTATLTDAGQNQYRVRRGDSIGNATVVDIGPTRIVFSIDDFGLRRQEVLELKATQGVVR